MKTNTVCDNCLKKIYKKPYSLKTYKKHYCSSICANKGSEDSINFNCNSCEKPMKRSRTKFKRYNSHYCSVRCKNNSINYKHGKKVKYRKKALKALPHKCNNKNCILHKHNIKIEIFLLDVDHINGNRSDSSLSNLQLLCVLCHALKTRTGSLIE